MVHRELPQSDSLIYVKLENEEYTKADCMLYESQESSVPPLEGDYENNDFISHKSITAHHVGNDS